MEIGKIALLVAIAIFLLVVGTGLFSSVPFPVAFERGLIAAIAAFVVARVAPALRSAGRNR